MALRLPVVCPLTSISHDAVSLYLVEGFQWNLLQIFTVWVGITENVFKTVIRTQFTFLWRRTFWQRGIAASLCCFLSESFYLDIFPILFGAYCCRYYSSEEQHDDGHSHKTTECYLEQVTANLCTIFQVCLYIVIQCSNDSCWSVRSVCNICLACTYFEWLLCWCSDTLVDVCQRDA